MAKFNEKLSTILSQQLPEYVVADHPKFADFLKTYYQLLESAKIEVTSVQTTVGILLETETGQENNLVLNSTRIDTARTPLDGGDKIIYEESEFGKFQRGEVVKGSTSNATAVILVEDLANGSLIISAQDKFVSGEVIVGQSSNASATLDNYIPNPVSNIVDLVNFRDPDKAISYFLTNMRDEFLATMPESLSAEVDKRNLIKNVKSLYRSKGTQKGHELFFRLLFNENSETLYPREEMLKTSDGQFDSQKIMRVIARVGDPATLIGRTITGKNSNATALIENLQKFQIGTDEVTELVLNPDTIQGTFTVGEEIQGTGSDTDDFFIKADITGIPGTKTIANSGSLYTINDLITITAGGEAALFQIGETGQGGVSDLVIASAGSGYEIGDTINFDNTGTFGQGARGFVSVVTGSFVDQNGTINPPDGTEDNLILESATTEGDIYSGSNIVQERATTSPAVPGFSTSADNTIGEITKVFLTEGGIGYQSLPKLSITSSGTGGKIVAFGNEIGKIIKVSTVEHGKKYEVSPSPPTLTFFENIILKDISSTVPVVGTVSSGSKSGTIVSYDTDRNFLKLKDVTNGPFALNDTITFNNGTTAKIAKLNIANVTVAVASATDTDGQYISERGKLSESTMKIQDSLYYQDFSYVLKVGQSINQWRDAFKKTMHTTGFYFTGQVNIATRISMKTRTPIIGETSGAVDVGLFSIANTLFSTIFGRRLGTVDDGTSLRPKPQEAGDIDSDTSTNNHFEANTRDITLTRPGVGFTFQLLQQRTINDRSGNPITIATGHAYAGPRFKNLNKFANTIFGTQNTGSGITFQRLHEIKIQGTRTNLDGTSPIFFLTDPNNPTGQNMRMNFAFPSEVAFNADLFSNTLVKFDNTNKTFDDTTP